MTKNSAWGRGVRGAAPLGVLLLALLAGCTSTGGAPQTTQLSDEQIAKLWGADIALAKSHATSEFQIRVFEDNAISAAEYEEAVQLYVQCMQSTLPPDYSNFQATKNEYGLYGYAFGPYPTQETEKANAAQDSADAQCSPGTKDGIEHIYADRITNPKRQNPEERIVDCLKRHDLVPAAYTVQNFVADSGAHAPANLPDGAEVDPTQVTGLDMDSSDVVSCTLTPWD